MPYSNQKVKANINVFLENAHIFACVKPIKIFFSKVCTNNYEQKTGVSRTVVYIIIYKCTLMQICHGDMARISELA
jgi:hypothetical protein